MRPSAPHEMVHLSTDAAGMEEWRCPACGRHFVVRWPPNYERLVLAEGDEHATHVGAREGEAGLRGIQIRPAAGDPAEGGGPAEGDSQDAWRRWLAGHGIDWDGEVAEG